MTIRPSQKRLLGIAIVFALAALVYPTAGFHNTLIRDAGGYLYGGQQVLKGVPPYRSIFTHKGPLPTLITAAGVALAQPLRLPDVYSTRLLFYGIACLTVTTVYLLVEQALASSRAGFLAALTFLGFYPITFGATAGPEPKLPMLLFLSLNLYLTGRRRWFWAGLCGALAALTWQPTLIFAATTLLLAALQPRPGRRRAILLTLAGGALPTAAIIAYFAERRALYELVDRAIIFNVVYLDRGKTSLLNHILTPARVLLNYYTTALVPILIGLLVFVSLYFWRGRAYRSYREFIADPLAPLFIAFPAPVVWSLKDFQGAPDFFVFLPYVCVGFAFFLDSALRRLTALLPGRLGRYALTAGLCLVLLGVAVTENRARRDWGLESQLHAAQQLMARFGPELRVFARGLPQVLALTHTTSPTPYMNLAYVFDVQAQRIPGGFEGWLRQIAAHNPHIIAMDRAGGRYAERFTRWVAERYKAEKVWMWTIWVRKDLLRP